MDFKTPTHRLLGILALAASIACGGSSGGSSSPTAPPMGPPPAMASANFEISSGGQNESFSFMNGGNTVFCTRDAGWASLWIRMAEQVSANGENGPHIDIDLCNHDGGGTFGPKDPQDLSCGSGQSFDIWWHAADGTFYNNEAGAADCTFQMTQTGSDLAGTFECRGLTQDGGGGTVDVLNGSFDCTET